MGPKIDLSRQHNESRRVVGDFRQLPAIEWSDSRGGVESDTKYFTSGRDTRWECNKSKGSTLMTFGTMTQMMALKCRCKTKADLGLLRI